MNYIPGITEARSIVKDPALKFRWVVAMPALAGNTQISSNYNITKGVNSKDTSGFLSTPVVPVGRVHGVTLPMTQLDTDPRFGAATKTHYPRFMETQPIPVTFYEDSGYNTLKYLISWGREVVDQNHNYKPANRYKKTIFFYAFSILSNYTPTLIVEAQGAFPTDPGNGLDYSYDESGAVILPCTFSVDYADYHWNASAPVAGNN
jgi:hypothetical protein